MWRRRRRCKIRMVSHEHNRSGGHRSGPQYRDSITQNESFANGPFRVDIMAQISEAHEQCLDNFTETAHSNLALVINLHSGFTQTSQRIEKKSMQSKLLNIRLDILVNVLEIFRTKAFEKMFRSNPKHRNVRNQIAPDERCLFRIFDAAVLKLRLNESRPKGFGFAADFESRDVGLGQGTQDKHLRCKSARNRVNVLLKSVINFGKSLCAIIFKDHVGMNRWGKSRIESLDRAIEKLFSTHSKEAIPNCEALDVCRILENFRFGNLVDLFADALDRGMPIAIALVVRHQELRRNLKATTYTHFAKLAGEIVRPVHQFLREGRGHPGWSFVRRERVLILPDASNMQDRKEDLDKFKGSARVVEVHRCGARTIGQVRLEVLDRDVGQCLRHGGVSRRKRVLALLAQSVEHGEVHCDSWISAKCREFVNKICFCTIAYSAKKVSFKLSLDFLWTFCGLSLMGPLDFAMIWTSAQCAGSQQNFSSTCEILLHSWSHMAWIVGRPRSIRCLCTIDTSASFALDSP